MTSYAQRHILLELMAVFSLALVSGGCSSSASSPGDASPAGSGGVASTGGTLATGGSTVGGLTGGVAATGGNSQAAGVGGSSVSGGTSGGGPVTGGASTSAGVPANGGFLSTGGGKATGGVVSSGGGSGTTTGGMSGGGPATGGMSGGIGIDAGTETGGTSSGGKTGGSSGGNTGGSKATGGSPGQGGATGGTLATGGTTIGDAGGPLSDVSGFHCFNWADKGDNFQAGVLQPSGLASSDNYATVKAKSDAILSGFQTVLKANSIRIPINESTIVTNPTWWAAYKGIFDSAISKNMKIIVAYWGQTGNNGGKPADVNVFYTMWQAVVDAYASNDLVYFDIMNEPWAYSPAAFIDLAAQWIAKFPSVPRNRIVVAGNYNDSDVNQQGKDPRLAGCLLSLHAYPSSSKTNTTTEQGWRDYIKTQVGPYYSRVIVSEWSGTPMSTGVDYSGAINGDVNMAYLVGVANQIKDYGMGSCWWAGLETGNTYAIAKVSGTGTNLSISVVNASGLARIQAAWGP